jgi:CheY-like chemotaxis protein
MFNEADLSCEHASILVASEAVADAELVGKLLADDFGTVRLSVKPESAVADFETHRPAVLVLAFDTIEAAQRYYLGLYRLGTTVHTVPHRTVLLCSSRDLHTAYELCRKEHFDDYVLFWPATNDAPRIRMSVHQALRLIRAENRAGESWLRAAPGQPATARPVRGAAHAPVASAPRASAQPGAGAPNAGWFFEDAQGASASAASAAAQAAQPLPAASPTPQPDRPKVLIVEDDEFQQKLLARLLSGQHLELAFAGTGAEAQSLMWEMKPDLVLMDVGLPDTSGVEATRAIKAIAQFAHVPIVMVTGHSERAIVVESLKAGAVDFLVKPFDRNTLIDKLRLFLSVTATS